MENFNKLFSFVLIFVLNLNLCVNATCNVCGVSGLACTSQTAYNVCAGGAIDSTQGATCPTGTVCNSGTAALCVSSTTGTASCLPATCKQCSNDLRYACITSNTYQLCFGTAASSGTIFTCPTGQYCDYTVTAPNFCVSNTVVTVRIKINY